MNAGSAPFARRALGNPPAAVEQPSINRKCPERAESIAPNNAASTQIKTSPASRIAIGGPTQWSGDINLQKESESKQKRERQKGGLSTALDHSGGYSRRRIGSLRGSRLVTPPLALAAWKDKTHAGCAERWLGTAKQNWACVFGAKRLEFSWGFGIATVLNIHTWLGILSLRFFGALV
jgi:hypothetical protein